MAKKKTNKNTSKKKKVLNQNKEVFDKTIKIIREDDVKLELRKDKNNKEKVIVSSNIHEKIQSFISILFTIIVFILLIFLIIVIYNNYLKPKNKINKMEVCKEYIKKDYNISKESIENYIKNNRHIIYNLNKYNVNEITNEDILEIAKYIIWNDSSDYIICDEDDKCLITKKEIKYQDLINILKNIVSKDYIYLDFSLEQNKDIYLYQKDDKVILTFNEFEYETLKHDLIDIIIDEDNITIYFGLSKKNSNYYNYVGSKKVILKYDNKKFILQNIETNIK